MLFRPLSYLVTVYAALLTLFPGVSAMITGISGDGHYAKVGYNYPITFYTQSCESSFSITSSGYWHSEQLLKLCMQFYVLRSWLSWLSCSTDRITPSSSAGLGSSIPALQVASEHSDIAPSTSSPSNKSTPYVLPTFQDNPDHWCMMFVWISVLELSRCRFLCLLLCLLSIRRILLIWLRLLLL